MPPQKFSLGIIQCSFHTIPQLLDELDNLLTVEGVIGGTILCVNAHIYNLAVHDVKLRSLLNNARICAADGMAIVWAARAFGVPLKQRCNMTEAFRAFLSREEGRPVDAILVGCTLSEAKAAAARINNLRTRCRVSVACSGFLSAEEYRAFFAAQPSAQLVLVGMGSPRSEMLAEMVAEVCKGSVVWHIGGGTIRILAGTMREAPRLWRRLGLQWLHRLATDPIRLWHRYLIGNPLFACRMMIAGLRRQIRPFVD